MTGSYRMGLGSLEAGTDTVDKSIGLSATNLLAGQDSHAKETGSPWFPAGVNESTRVLWTWASIGGSSMDGCKVAWVYTYEDGSAE